MHGSDWIFKKTKYKNTKNEEVRGGRDLVG